ncbi:uncharacterized protein LOC132375767 isoform X2 [Balaenoptera ricei]|uniref:uncharacterized protein LOC132375767 isoform X2 n=1 Tax=Balaenoptera ricei TaxID=2746895 RepID=UPI0028BD7E35|nr:uncharacterized protein LOC132375767 isoform X2 [Balaenoptera ricei]
MPPEDPGLRTRIGGPGQVLSKPRLRVLLGLPEKTASPTGRALADLTLLLKAPRLCFCVHRDKLSHEQEERRQLCNFIRAPLRRNSVERWTAISGIEGLMTTTAAFRRLLSEVPCTRAPRRRVKAQTRGPASFHSCQASLAVQLLGSCAEGTFCIEAQTGPKIYPVALLGDDRPGHPVQAHLAVPKAIFPDVHVLAQAGKQDTRAAPPSE